MPDCQIPIAIVGVGALMPGSTDVDGFWHTVVTGRDQITDIPATHWLVEDYYDPDPAAEDKTYCKRGAFLPQLEFDPLAFGIPPNSLEATDTAQLLALVVAEQVLNDAAEGRQNAPLDRERVGVILGTGQTELFAELESRTRRPLWDRALREHGIAEPEAKAISDRIAAHHVPWREASFPGLLGNVVAGRVANKFDLHGTNCTIDAACAASLAALSMAVDELSLGRADMVVTGGVDTLNDAGTFMSFSKSFALSRTGDCRPFSDAADGTILGEGIVMFALRRLDDAERDGDRIYAVIRGIGSSSDGRGTAIFAPLPAGQARALRRAYEAAGYDLGTVGLVEAHGTGTTVGDAAEVAALRDVAADSGRTDRPWCALGSVKSQVGHTKWTAGAAGLLKAAMALRHQILPPTIKVDRPDPGLGLEDSPFYLNMKARPWVHSASHPRRASVSSFGFGGTNFHVTLEEYVPRGGRAAWRSRTAPSELVLLSAPTPERLVEWIQGFGAGRPLADLAQHSQQRFRADDEARLAVVAADTVDLAVKLEEAAEAIERRPHEAFSTPKGVHYGVGSAGTGRIAYLFPGQGSQYVGMGGDVTMQFARAQAIWDRVDRLSPADDFLSRVVFPVSAFDDDGRAAQRLQLTATHRAQPALAAHSLVLLDLLRALNLHPDCVAGHSLGELVALQHAGVFDADTLIELARRRGELMRDAAVVPGAMLAVSIGRAEVQAVLEACDTEQVWIANHNAPNQLVLSGAVDALATVRQKLVADGIASTYLDTATAFHSPLVASAVEPLLAALDAIEIRPPRIEVYGNADAAPYPADPAEIRRRVSAQVVTPVRFADQIESMYEAGVRTFIEVGAGSALTGLVGGILADRPHWAVALDRRGRHGVTVLHEALAGLAVRGVPLDFAALWESYRPVRQTTVVNSSRATVQISGANQRAAVPLVQERPPPASALEPRRSHADPGWFEIVRESQRQTADTYAGYQRVMADFQQSMADSHLAFMKTAEASFTMMSTYLGGGGEPPGLPSLSMPVPEQSPPEIPFAPSASAPSAPMAPAIPVIAEDLDVESLLLGVIAAKTGYPVDMLEPGMDLESDLGIDSIKRVEILSAMRAAAPHLAAADTSEQAGFGKLRTISEIVERLQGLPPGESVPTTRLVVRAVAEPAPGIAMPGLGRAPLMITEGSSGVAPLVLELLAGQGIAAEIVSVVPEDARAVLYLGGLRDVISVEEAMNIQRAAFQAARTVAPAMTATGGIFVTVQRTGGDFGLTSVDSAGAWLGGLAALARTAAKEWPKASVKAIDCAHQDRNAIAAAIVQELTTGGSTLNVGLGSTRVTLREDETPALPGTGPSLGDRPVIVATGGARGVTAAALLELAAKYRPRLVLIGRTVLEDEGEGLSDARSEEALVAALAQQSRGNGSVPDLLDLATRAQRVLAVREVRATLDTLSRAGATVRYVPLDVRDGTAVARALAEVRSAWGPITGLVHGAGVLADRKIADKTDEQFDRVFGTKVDGLHHLLAATANDPLRLLCAFSSVAASHGNPGQCDYAMANEVLTHVVAVERGKRPDCLARAIAWGPWNGGMVTHAVAAQFGARDMPLIPLKVGAKAFVRELEDGPGSTSVIIVAGRGRP
ncbi:type I polyketide synthase [Actinomadura alba]|uniref:SDR family oxidoreductase n=1 Tax=Actinomadura alba TaxID=406431 RepID=A0ABR7LJP1_9ACTN|nr:type I polyketide synthase [Actinomadura alba]MBC6465065.1 SDR family oxidoreductase [Actinomadura alba]